MLRLLEGFMQELRVRVPRELKLQMANCPDGYMVVEVIADNSGCLLLDHGWRRFARAYDLQQGYFLHFDFDGDDVLFVKVFGFSLCREFSWEESEYDLGEAAPAAIEM